MSEYHDFVIKDGRFVGKFEEMYGACDNPWHQSDPEHHRWSPSRNATLLQLKRFGVTSVVEFGCGLGYFTNMLQEGLGARVCGVDISPKAIELAKARFPGLDFRVDSARNIEAYRAADAVVFAEITWYILPDLAAIFAAMLRAMPGKLFVQNLSFYKEADQKYGREYFTSLEEFIEFCPFQPLSWQIAGRQSSDPVLDTNSVFRVQRK